MCLCSTLLALSCGQIIKLLCLLWFLQFTRLAAHLFSPEGGAITQVCGFFPAHRQDLFWVGSWSSRARFHGHTAEQAQGASSRVGERCGFNTWCIGSAHTPGREIPRVVPPGVPEWTSYWAHVFDTIWNSYLPLSQYPSFPQSWSSHLSTPDAGREKQVFPAVFHLTRVAGCLCQKNQPLEVFPWREGWCWESFSYHLCCKQTHIFLFLQWCARVSLQEGWTSASSVCEYLPRAALTWFLPYSSERGLGSFAGSIGSLPVWRFVCLLPVAVVGESPLGSPKRPTKAPLFMYRCLNHWLKREIKEGMPYATMSPPSLLNFYDLLIQCLSNAAYKVLL